MKIERVKVDSLLPDPSNARQHSNKNLDAIKASLKKFEQVEPLVVQRGTNVVIGGNGRLAAMKELGIEDTEVHYLDVDNTTAKALGIALNRTAETASWDMDILGDTLQGLREDEWDLGDIGFELDDMDEMFPEESTGGHGGDEENIYTSKIEAPIYEITGEKPAIGDLFDLNKTQQLIDKINNSPVADADKMFLINAAQRHTIFNYEKIAEYYAHASEDLQRLMEDSALVVIDFNKAIENGFIQLTKDIQEGVSENDFLRE